MTTRKEDPPAASPDGIAGTVTAAFAGDALPALQAEALLDELPGVYRTVAEVLGMWCQWAGEKPVGHVIGDHLGQLAQNTATLGEQAKEAGPMMRDAHPGELGRLKDPRPLEGVTFDLSAQGQGGPKP